jgi:hypothetical protein
VLDINPNFAHVDKRSAGHSMFGALKNSVRGFDESQIGATLLYHKNNSLMKLTPLPIR